MQKSVYNNGILITGLLGAMSMLFIPNHLETMVWVIFLLGLAMLGFSIMRLKAEKKAGMPTDRIWSIIIGSIISSAIGLGLTIMTVFTDL